MAKTFKWPPVTVRLKVKVTKQCALPIYTHIPNLKVLTKIFFKLSRPKGNLCGGGMTVLNPKYPRLSSGDTIRTSLQAGEWVTFHRLQRGLLPHTNSKSVQEVHAFSPPGSVLPVQSPTLWSIHSSHGVHSGGQRGQTHGTSEGYKDLPVPRRLAGESLYPQHLSPAYSNPGHTLSGTRVAGEQGEVRTGSQTGFQLRRLPVRT